MIFWGQILDFAAGAAETRARDISFDRIGRERATRPGGRGAPTAENVDAIRR